MRKSLFKNLLFLFITILFIKWVIPSTISQYRHTAGYYQSSLAQQEFARVVKSYIDQGYKIGVNGWWQAPEISFLLDGFKFKKFTCSKEYPKNFLVLFTRLQESMSPQEAASVKQCLSHVIETSLDHEYLLYLPKTNR